MPASMMFLWALCAVPFGVYAIVQNFNIPYVITLVWPSPMCMKYSTDVGVMYI